MERLNSLKQLGQLNALEEYLPTIICLLLFGFFALILFFCADYIS